MRPRARSAGGSDAGGVVGAAELERADRLERLGLGPLVARAARTGPAASAGRRRQGRGGGPDLVDGDERRARLRSAARGDGRAGSRCTRGPWQRLEPLGGDRACRTDARAVGAGVQAGEGRVDRRELRLRGRAGRGPAAARRPGSRPRPASRRSSGPGATIDLAELAQQLCALVQQDVARARRRGLHGPMLRRRDRARAPGRILANSTASPPAPEENHGHRRGSRVRHGGRHGDVATLVRARRGRPTGSAARAACSSSRTIPASTSTRTTPRRCDALRRSRADAPCRLPRTAYTRRMPVHVVWFLIAIALLVVELASTTFYAIFLAAGAAVAGLMAFLVPTSPAWLQAVVAGWPSRWPASCSSCPILGRRLGGRGAGAGVPRRPRRVRRTARTEHRPDRRSASIRATSGSPARSGWPTPTPTDPSMPAPPSSSAPFVGRRWSVRPAGPATARHRSRRPDLGHRPPSPPSSPGHQPLLLIFIFAIYLLRSTVNLVCRRGRSAWSCRCCEIHGIHQEPGLVIIAPFIDAIVFVDMREIPGLATARRSSPRTTWSSP